MASKKKKTGVLESLSGSKPDGSPKGGSKEAVFGGGNGKRKIGQMPQRKTPSVPKRMKAGKVKPKTASGTAPGRRPAFQPKAKPGRVAYDPKMNDGRSRRMKQAVTAQLGQRKASSRKPSLKTTPAARPRRRRSMK